MINLWLGSTCLTLLPFKTLLNCITVYSRSLDTDYLMLLCRRFNILNAGTIYLITSVTAFCTWIGLNVEISSNPRYYDVVEE